MSVKSLFKNPYVFSIITKIILVILGILHASLLARYLGSTLKGEIAYIQGVVDIISIVIAFGLQDAYTYYRRRDISDNFLSRFMNTTILIFVLNLAISIVLFIFLKEYNFVIFASFLIAPIWGYNRIVTVVYLVESPNRRNLFLVFFSLAEIALLVILFIYTKPTIVYGLVCILFAETLKTIVFSVFIRFKVSLRFIDFKVIGKCLAFGALPMIALLFTMLNYKIDIFMLKMSPNITYANIGIYSVGVALAEKTLLLPDSMKEILLYNLSNGKGEEEVSKISRVSFFISIVTAVIISALAYPFIWLLYGVEYIDSFIIVLISIIGMAFMVFFKMISQYNIIKKMHLANLLLLSVSIALNCGLNLIFIPLMSINGAALATLISHIICAFLFIIYFNKKTGQKIKDVIFIKRIDFSLIKSFFLKRNQN